MSFKDDKEWNIAKNSAKIRGRKNDWVLISTLYLLNGGKGAVINAILEIGKVQIMFGEDNTNMVVVKRQSGALVRVPYDDVLLSRKSFEYHDSGFNSKEYISDHEILGKKSFKYFDIGR